MARSRFEGDNLRRSMKRYREETGKSRKEVCVLAAKGFIKEIVGITPPSSSKATGQAAKQAGERTIQNDILKIAQPVFVEGRRARKELADAAAILAAHDRARSGNRGRVNPRNRKEKLFALQSVVIGVITKLQKNVGWLPAGWITAAQKYKVSIPLWIRRHGSAPGQANEVATSNRFTVTVSNDVGFVGDVKDYERRVQSAIGLQAQKMERMTLFLIEKAAKKAGF